MPKENLAKKLEYGAMTLFFAIAIVLSLRHIAAISSDIENGAAIDPVKMTDFTRKGAYDKSSFILFSNTSSKENLTSDQNGLKITNFQDKYSSFLAQPVILQKDTKYKASLEYEMIGDKENFSATYGVVIGDFIGEPLFSQNISRDQNNTSFEFVMSEITPISFQYIRVLGEGQFVLRSIFLEELGDVKLPDSSNKQKTEVITGNDESLSDQKDLLTVESGWNPYGAKEAIETKIFTQKNIGVYLMQSDGWKIAKPIDKNSNFTIPEGQGVYLLNETGSEVEVELSSSQSSDIIKAGKNWNILFSGDKSKTNEIVFELEGAITDIEKAVAEGKIAKFAYLINPQTPSDMTKLDFNKIKDIPSNNLIWFYVF